MTEPRGRIYLVARAPVDITYEHTIDFKDANEQNAYWRSLVKFELSDYSYVRRERQYITIDKPFEALDGINYLFFQAREDSNSKWYYAFVTDRKYVGDDATTLFFEIDVLQSYMFDYSFKPSYVAQSHVDRWNASHKPIYSYTEEGLAYGDEYLTEAAFRIKPESGADHGFYLVFCTRHADFEESGDASEPSIAKMTPTPYCIYLLHDQPEPAEIILQYSDESMITFNAAGLKEFNAFMANSAIGDYIHQIVYVPYLPYQYSLASKVVTDQAGTQKEVNVYFLIDETGNQTFAQTTLKSDSRTITLIKINDVGDKLSTFVQNLATMKMFKGIEECIPNESMWNALKAAPYTTERDRRFESKLLCYPYRYNLFTDWKTKPVLIKNEYLTGDNITVAQVFSYGFNLNRRYYVKNYRNDLEGREASIFDNLPIESPVFSDAYYQYMLQNKNQISANLTNTKINAAHGAISGAFSGATSGAAGGPVGALVGAVVGGATAGISGALNVQATIRSENAKQKDIAALPDTFTETSDSIMARIDKTSYLSFYRKSICCNFAEQIAQYWHMYGYVVRRMEVPNLRSRLRFNYIKTIGANLEGNVESAHMAMLKNIYNNGVTIWHYSAEHFKPLDYTYENPERNLI